MKQKTERKTIIQDIKMYKPELEKMQKWADRTQERIRNKGSDN